MDGPGVELHIVYLILYCMGYITGNEKIKETPCRMMVSALSPRPPRSQLGLLVATFYLLDRDYRHLSTYPFVLSM